MEIAVYLNLLAFDSLFWFILFKSKRQKEFQIVTFCSFKVIIFL